MRLPRRLIPFCFLAFSSGLSGQQPERIGDFTVLVIKPRIISAVTPPKVAVFSAAFDEQTREQTGSLPWVCSNRQLRVGINPRNFDGGERIDVIWRFGNEWPSESSEWRPIKGWSGSLFAGIQVSRAITERALQGGPITLMAKRPSDSSSQSEYSFRLGGLPEALERLRCG